MPYSLARRAAAAALVVATAVACADGSSPAAPDARGDHTGNPCDHDATAPVVSSIGATPSELWPPNHKMVAVAVSLTATDDCSAVTSAITSVTSDEPVNDIGDGNTAPDWTITGALTLLLRAERQGPGDGRVYTIGVTSTDASGNGTTSFTTVVVPHDQGNGKGKGKP